MQKNSHRCSCHARCAPNDPVKPAVDSQQDRTERQKIQARAQHQTGEREQPEQAAPRIEREKKQRRRERQCEQHIKRQRQSRAQTPERTQRVVEYAQRQPQQHGGVKLGCLQRDRQLHQPKSRAKKPPAGASSS